MLVIFSGYNQRAVIAFLRCLAKNKYSKYVIIASSKEDSIMNTWYKKNVFCIREKKELNKDEIFTILLAIKKKYEDENMIIMPTTEALNRFLLEYNQQLEQQHIIVPLVNRDVYEKVSDKEKFWNICRKNGLLVPDNIKLSDCFMCSYVAKPKKYQTDTGKVYSPIIVTSAEQHRKFLREYNQKDFMYQEYISGDSYYLLYYFSKNGTVHSFSQINYSQQLNGKSILVAESARIHEEIITQDYCKLFHKLNFIGLVMVEVRKNEKGYYMIEANPRFWGPSQLFVDADVPLFEEMLSDYGVNILKRKHKIKWGTKYLWAGGCPEGVFNTEKEIWINNSKLKVVDRWNEFMASDIYNREDTKEIFDKVEGN